MLEIIQQANNNSRLKPNFNDNICIDIPVHVPGAFEFYTTYTPLPKFTTGPVEKPEPTSTKSYYIDVAPALHVGKTKLPLDAISVISCLSKFMGKYPEDWERHLHCIS